MRVRATILAVVVASLCAAFATSAPSASAASGVRFGLTDDAWLANGPGTLDQRIATLKSIGVRIVRFTLAWNQIAPGPPTVPTDPNDEAYEWTQPDQIVDGLHAAGIDVMLQLLDTPQWANNGRGTNYAPTSGATFGAFAKAAARHYPWVKKWLIWDEPNQARWLRPTSAAIYTIRLLNPAYIAIHSVIRGAQVGGGGSAPRGSTGGVSPVAWLKGMHAAHARLDAYAYNPYPLNPKVESPLRGGCKICATIPMSSINRLSSLVGADFGRRARVWLTEYGYQTNPPDRLLGVSQSLQARYIGESAYQAWHSARVDMLIQYLYRDEPNIARFQSGLVTINNSPKLSYAAFELPLAEVARRGSQVTLWGELRAPAAASTVHVQRLIGGHWAGVAVKRATTAGYWTLKARLAPYSVVRVVSGRLIGASLRLH
ncbi:MAG TPA: family 1 glycosylhydrolase [Gaiellaceae bacterium]|nr:family 1 glycosylhydrolase [Gaiellaceae bacterium]